MEQFKYFIYCRKSNGNEKDASPSIDSQYRELMTYSQKENMNIIGVYKEVQSAFEDGRPKFAEMIERIKDGDANGILVWEISRLSRNMQDNALIDNLLKKGCLKKIKTPSRDYVSEDGEDFMLNMEFVISRQYSKEISKRVKRGINYKIQNKEWPSSAPLGYINFNKNRVITGFMTDERRRVEKIILDKCKKENREIKRTEIDPIKGPMVKKVFEDFATGNYSIEAMRKIMQEMGLRNKLGNTPSINCTFCMLRNPFYYGVMRHKGVIFDGNQQPLITKSLFDKVQEVIKIKNKPFKKRWNFEFTGLMKCGECGCGITGYQKFKNNRFKGRTGYIYYGCTHMRDIIRRTACSQHAVTNPDLRKQFEKQIKKLIIDDAVKKMITEAVKMSHEKEKELHQKGLQEWQSMYTVAENKINKLFELYYNGSLNQAEFTERKYEIEQEKFKAKEHLESHSEAQKAWIDYSETLLITTDHIYTIFKEGTPEEVKMLMSAIGKNYVLLDGKISFQLKEPFNYIAKLNDSRSSNKCDMRGQGDLNPRFPP